MKRLLMLFIALLTLALTMGLLVACQENDNTSQNTQDTHSDTSNTTSPTADTTSAPETEKLLTADGNALSSFENPLLSYMDENTWEKYGVGDPFVMRYNGKYYLYCSTRDNFVGIQCWSSLDLVNWQYEGLCATEELTKTAYAPEVTYYNGYFYLYTSPAGNGHYVLKSTSPTGPFTAVTGNFGLSIDGHVFIDDDGRWYFYSASGEGIKAYRMTAPDKVTPTAYNTGASINGWTEGAMVIKVNGTYYMTYTGNHVLAKGYRINYATSTRNPITFTPAENNPILLNTTDAVNGIGHSSTVLGPDLDSYYIVYHSLLDRMPNRDMRIDRIVFNGTTMSVLGPTVTGQQTPTLPKIYSYFGEGATTQGFRLENATLTKEGILLENGTLLSEMTLSSNYTAEFNLLSIESGKAGAYFSYVDENNYGKALFDPATQSLTVIFLINGEKTEKTIPLVKSFDEDIDFSALQLLTVKKEGTAFTFLVNNRTLTTAEGALSGGAIGYLAEGKAEFGFIGGSEYVNGSSVRDYYKPLPGSIQAIDSVKEAETVKKDSAFAVSASTGALFSYYVNVAAKDSYDLGILYKADTDTTIALYQNKTLVTELTLPKTEDYATAIFRALPLEKGFSAINLEVQNGSVTLLSFAFDTYVAVEAESHSYDTASDTPTYSDGEWKLAGGSLTLDGGSASVGKYLYGSEHYGDYTVEADITPKGSINFGILVRATNPSLGDAGNSAPAGSDFVQGYFIGLSSGALVLGKQNYNWQQLDSVPYTFTQNTTYHLAVTVKGGTITVSVDGEELLTYTDPTPYLQGMTGLRGHYSVASVDNFTVTPLDE